jgi:hypothetical protein
MTARKQWVFFERCGCPFGVLEAAAAGRTLTRSEAWRGFYDTARERNAAMDRGVTSELVDHDVYVRTLYPQMLSAYVCPHGGAA